MGKMKTLVLVAFTTAVLLTGCASVMSPAMGTIYSDVKAPIGATSNVGQAKSGSAFCESYLGVIALGDASIEAAAKSAGITKIHHVDYQAMNILGFYAKLTVTVYGE